MKIVQNASIENFSSKEKIIDLLFQILHLIVNYVTRLFANIITFNGFFILWLWYILMFHVISI